MWKFAAVAITGVLTAALIWLPLPEMWWLVARLAFYIPILMVSVRLGPIAGLSAGVAATILVALAATSRGMSDIASLGILTPDLALVGLLGGKLPDLLPRFRRQHSFSPVEVWPAPERISEPKASADLNSLASIQSAAVLLAEDDTPAELRQELAGIISTECGRLSASVKGLLQQGSGVAPRLVGEADVAALADSVIRQAEFVLCGQGVKVRKEIAANLPRIQCDPVQIRSLLMSLTTSAAESVPPGVQVILNVHSGKDGVILEIQEQSTGVSVSQHVKRFFGSHPATTTAGLAAAYEIVRQHGGTIDARINESKGLEFSVWLPLSQNNTNGCRQGTGGGR